MPLTLRRTVPPTVEPVSLLAVKQHLRIETDDADPWLADYITAARDEVETYLQRQLLPATLVLYLDAWPAGRCPIRLPRPPATAVTAIEYVDTGGTLQTLAASVYQVDVISEPARIVLQDGETWPTLATARLNAIAITYTAGWATPSQVPSSIRQAVLLLVGDLYEHREARLDIGMGVSAIADNSTYQRLLWKHRLLEVS
jgi:uncharacterized phiE125 gp8 family phage protein